MYFNCIYFGVITAIYVLHFLFFMGLDFTPGFDMGLEFLHRFGFHIDSEFSHGFGFHIDSEFSRNFPNEFGIFTWVWISHRFGFHIDSKFSHGFGYHMVLIHWVYRGLVSFVFAAVRAALPKHSIHICPSPSSLESPVIS